MDLDDRLKSLKNLPEDQATKKHIYEQLHQKKQTRFSQWKEISLLIAIFAISFFLLIVPMKISNEQTASNSVEEIYRYFGGEEGEFFARGSLLYLGIDQVKDPLVYSFFENYTNFMKQQEGKLGNHIADVVVVRNGVEERFQISETGMLHVDSGTFYNGDNEVYSKVFDRVYDADVNSLNFISILIILGVNMGSVIYYKRKKIEFENPLKDKWWMGLVIFLIMVALGLWHFLIGPLYLPFVIVLTLLYAYIIWRTIKRYITSYLVYRVESIKIVLLTIALLLIVLSY